MSNGINKPSYSRTLSMKPDSGTERDADDVYNVRDIPRSVSSVKVGECREVKYRKAASSGPSLASSTRGAATTGSRSCSVHSVRELLRRVDQQRLYLCSKSGHSCVVYGEGSERYTVTVGPQACSCGSSGTQGSLACVHLLFVMCKVLQVHDTDPLLLADRLSHQQVEELFQRFNKRRKKLVQMKNTYRTNEKELKPANVEVSSDAKRVTRDEPMEQHPFPSIDEITCSICLQEMSLSQALIYCRFCNNEFHKKCINIWKKECTKQKEELTCPLCRKQWPPDDINSDVTSSASDTPTCKDYKFHNSLISPQHCDTLEMSNVASSTSDLTKSSVYFNISGSRSSTSIAASSRKPLGYCFSAEVTEMLSSEMMDKREAGLRLVAEKTVHIVLSAGSAYSTGDATISNFTDTMGQDLVSSMGGHTTGMMLKEAFHIIARLLDDINYKLFVGALRAFREILGFLVCRSENDLERMSRMISPVFCQLLRICGDSSHKKKSQMSLSALFELAKGQEGGMALGRELKTTSLQVTGWQRMSKFVLNNNTRFRASHSYGRLALIERLVEKFDLTQDVLRKILEFVTNQLILMHRCLQLANSGSGKLEMVETTDVDTGLSSSDIILLSGQRLHKLAKVVFISTSKLIMSKLKFNGWSSHDIYTELWKELNRLPLQWKDKFLIKLKIPWRECGDNEAREGEKVACQADKSKVERTSNIPTSVSASNVSKSSRLSKRCSNVRPVGSGNKGSGGLQSASSVTSLKVRSGTGAQTMRSSSSGSCRISPFIRITPEPAYDAVPASESEDDLGDGHCSVFFSELAIHNSTYGHQFGLQEPKADDRQEEDAVERSGVLLRSVVNFVVAENGEEDIESRPPPGLGVFSSEYRSGYEWCQGPLLGTGAFSKCYQGRDVRTGLLMAVKQIAISHSCVDKNEEVINAVKTEVNLMIQLRHPNVLPLLGAVFSDNVISMFIRWMPGGSVASLLSQYGAFLEAATLAYSLQAARGLSYIHANRILHRDLKGANLLLDSSGMRLRISDFGASARLSNGRDSNAGEFKGQLLGTIAFMAPEVLRGEEYGRSCDVWSFACCIIEMLTGSQPWRDRNHTNHLALMYTIASAEEPPSLPEKISTDLNDLLKNCLNRDPKKRPLSSQLEHFKVFTDFVGQ